jgi:tetratricopeptide (TPR) repeat protein
MTWRVGLRRESAILLHLAAWMMMLPADAAAADRFAAQAPGERGAPRPTISVFGIAPGTTTRAQVELLLGEPAASLPPHFGYARVFEYRPPREAQDAVRLVIVYFADTPQVARVDVHLRNPIEADPLRAQFGARVLERPLDGDRREELYHPRLQSLTLAGDVEPASVTAIGFLSPRYLADVFVERYNERIQSDRNEDACLEADKAVLVDPDYARGYTAQGLCFQLVRQNVDEAVVRFTAATQAAYGPRARSDAHVRLGLVQWRVKTDPARAQQEFERAVALAPDSGFARYSFGAFLRGREAFDDAVRELSRALDIDANDRAARAELADLHYDRRAWNLALPHYERLAAWAASSAAASTPASARAAFVFRHAYTLAQLDRDVEARSVYETVVRLDPANGAAWNNLGLLYRDAGDLLRALAAHESALALQPDDVTRQRNYAMTLLEAGRVPDALRQLQAALGAEPGDATTMLYLARGFAAQKKKRETLDWLRRAIEAGYRNGPALASDRYLARYHEDRDFKRLLDTIR